MRHPLNAAATVLALLAGVLAPNAARAATINQWATAATASSEYSSGFLATAATGAPNAPGCDRSGGVVWATRAASGTGDLTLTYAQAVYPQTIHVYQNNLKGAISTIEVSNDGTAWTTVYTGTPATASNGICHAPDTTVFDDVLDVTVTNVSVPITMVRISVDQDPAQDWAEIDAVELVGSDVPIATPVAASRTIGVISGSSALTRKARSDLRHLVAAAGPDAMYTVTGTATRRAGVSLARVHALAERRAAKTKAFLISLGVRRSHIAVRTSVHQPGVTPKITVLARDTAA